MNRKKTQSNISLNRLLFVILLVGCCQFVSAQKYFEFSDDSDSLATNFYDRKLKFTICYLASSPHNYFGASVLMHYNNERFSSYFEYTTNVENTYIVTGQDYEEISTRQKQVKYNSWVAATGVASAIGSDWIVYISVGVKNQTTEFGENPVLYSRQEYYFNLTRNELELNLGVGAFYILPNKITIQGGFDITSDSFKLGLGYTF